MNHRGSRCVVSSVRVARCGVVRRGVKGSTDEKCKGPRKNAKSGGVTQVFIVGPTC